MSEIPERARESNVMSLFKHLFLVEIYDSRDSLGQALQAGHDERQVITHPNNRWYSPPLRTIETYWLTKCTPVLEAQMEPSHHIQAS